MNGSAPKLPVEIVCCLLLLGAAFCLLCLFEESQASRQGVTPLLAVGLCGLIIERLSPELRGQQPRGYGTRNPYVWVALALGYASLLPARGARPLPPCATASRKRWSAASTARAERSFRRRAEARRAIDSQGEHMAAALAADVAFFITGRRVALLIPEVLLHELVLRVEA